VTEDGTTQPLPPPFLCIATQNPVDFHGTYPLPEAQLDRFTLQLSLGYAPETEERRILAAQQRGHPLADVRAVTSAQQIVDLYRAVDAVMLEDSVSDYLFRIVHATRHHASVRLGVSMRGALLFARMARARAVLRGRTYVLPEDIKTLTVPVLAHRLVLDTRARYSGADKRNIVSEIAGSVPVPR
jgi:MoxR-like ATPase